MLLAMPSARSTATLSFVGARLSALVLAGNFAEFGASTFHLNRVEVSASGGQTLHSSLVPGGGAVAAAAVEIGPEGDVRAAGWAAKSASPLQRPRNAPAMMRRSSSPHEEATEDALASILANGTASVANGTAAKTDDDGDDMPDPECADPVSAHTMCKVLDGTNDEVRQKLERAIKALNIEVEGHEAVSTLSKDESAHMTGLRTALWDLYFCAHAKNPKCDPKHDGTPNMVAARNKAKGHLTALQADDGSVKSTSKQTFLNAMATLGATEPVT